MRAGHSGRQRERTDAGDGRIDRVHSQKCCKVGEVRGEDDDHDERVRRGHDARRCGVDREYPDAQHMRQAVPNGLFDPGTQAELAIRACVD